MSTKKQSPSNQGGKAADAQRQIEKLQQQLAELTEALQRERADAVNLRRRHDEQIASLKNVVKANVIRDLLPVIDNFERALKHVPQEASHEDQKLLDWIDGVKKILAQFEKTLEQLGVEKIKTVGEPFDPKYHEAVSVDGGDGGEEVVSEELQPGYKLGDDLIRHAMVRVRV